ncbi:MAG: hypothetical protein EB078_07380 [Proteobacteria bacterium]|nr:hypothetical protein [Pseudomonadota bacterium]NDD04711.1 hypothetical protein [Pseudomonadota bacterium]NDG27171.1 hypothetical protein [Pseudomonadota bacterium]
MVIRLFTKWNVFFAIMLLGGWCQFASAESRAHSQSSLPHSHRPLLIDKTPSASIWDWGGLKQRVWGAYEDTITWNVDLVFGKKSVDGLCKALLAFFYSPEGRRFVFENKRTFLVSQLEDTKAFEESFWKSFEAWISQNGYQDTFENNIVNAINLIPLKPTLTIHAYYPQTPLRQSIVRGVDHIQYLLADDIARTMPGGGLAPGIIANGIRRAARGEAILSAVQTSYNQSRNALTDRIVNLVGVVAKRLLEQGIKKHSLDVKATLTVTPWEKTEGFRKNPTFPIRSYYYAANEKKAIIPSQVTGFLDSVDEFDFQDIVNELRPQRR